MPRYFLDSSALVKRYHAEPGTSALEKLIAAPGNRFFISRLAFVEVQSCFARLVRESVMTEQDFGGLVTRMEDDVAAGRFAVAALSSRRLDAAATVLSTQGLKHNIRTLDAIHHATAQAIHGRTPLAGFVAADKKLLAAAADACGLIAVPLDT